MSNSKKIDYAFKSKILCEHSELLKQSKRSMLLEYARGNFIDNGVVMNCLNYKGYLPMQELLDKCKEEDTTRELNECIKINNAEIHRTARLKERVKDMLTSGPCLFLTLTFKDETLNNTTEQKRRIAVVRYLKSCNGRYVANIDFGKLNHREHYHALINADKVIFNDWHKYGAIKVEKVRINLEDNDKLISSRNKLSKYIAKLTNHAIKETTKRSALIYSR